MKTRFLISLVVALLLSAAHAHAQTITSYPLKIWNVGATAPISTTVLPASSFVCNQTAPTVPPSVINPTKLAIDDVVNVGKVCIYTDSPGGPLLGLPFSSQPLQATLAATNSAGTSPDSAVSNSFTRPGLPPPAPTAVRAVP
jgi:hypothetical protein